MPTLLFCREVKKMIKEIEIENFRCFDHTKISGFERVNLIGGKNNSGKTALLEALLINHIPSNIIQVRHIRNEPNELEKIKFESIWNNLFLNREINKSIKITAINEHNIQKNIDITVLESIPSELFEDINFKQIATSTLESKRITSILKVQIFMNSKESEQYFHFDVLRDFYKKQMYSPFMIVATDESFLKTTLKSRSIAYLNSQFNGIKDMPIITSSLKLTHENLVEEYDIARFKNQESEVLKAFQIIDQSIESIESFSAIEPVLFITKSGKTRLPLYLFGDALNRIASIILKLVNNNFSILFIDEIENGIHYSNQKEFWLNLFKLSKQFDVQVFATTHSLEMIQAFADVGLSEVYKNQGAYFEMARHYKTNQIIGIKRELDTLDYAIEHGKGVRGE